MESTEIVKSTSVLVRNVDDLSRVGKMMATSRYFEDALDIAKASVKVAAGMEMGFGPFASMTGIHIIKGKPAVGANLMAAAVKSNPRYDYRVRKMEDEEVSIEFFERIDGKLESIGTSSFTSKDAQKAGTQNMGKFPRNMLFARAISNGIKWYCPDVFAGNTTYVPEELGAEVDDEGNVLSIPQNTPQNAPEQPAVIEAEVTPITAAPTEEQPAEAQETASEKPKKKEWNDSEFLAKYQRPAGVAEMSYKNAETFTAQDGTPYVKLSTRELYGHWCGLSKRIKTENQAEAELTAMSISAICSILQKRKLDDQIKDPNDGRPDPFVKA